MRLLSILNSACAAFRPRSPGSRAMPISRIRPSTALGAVGCCVSAGSARVKPNALPERIRADQSVSCWTKAGASEGSAARQIQYAATQPNTASAQRKISALETRARKPGRRNAITYNACLLSE